MSYDVSVYILALIDPDEEGDMSDGRHCVHWYDDDGPCCHCGYDGPAETHCQPIERSPKLACRP